MNFTNHLAALCRFINVLTTTVNHPGYFPSLQNLQFDLKLDATNVVIEITEDDKESA